MNNYYNSICILSWSTLVVLSVLIYENARIPENEKKRFYLTYALIALSQLAEWAGLELNGRSDDMMILLRIVKCADYICTPLIGAFLIEQLRIRNRLNQGVAAIVAFNTVFQIISAFNGWVFYITSDNHYDRGPLYPLYLLIAAAVVLIVTAQFVIYGRNYRRQNQLSLYLILTMVLLSIAMQELLPSAARTMYIGFTIVMALLFIHISEYSQMAADDVMTQQLIKINTDALTGLYSRHAYSQTLKKYNAMESLPEDFTAFSIDINGLKQVNDTHGHEAGDDLIIGAARCIETAVGNRGKCFRTGGDEFIVLAHVHRKEADEMIRRLEEEEKRWRGPKTKELHMAVGCAMAADYPQLIAEKVIHKADLDMYTAKENYYRIREKRKDLRKYTLTNI